jgi:hypothetical protein
MNESLEFSMLLKPGERWSPPPVAQPVAAAPSQRFSVQPGERWSPPPVAQPELVAATPSSFDNFFDRAAKGFCVLVAVAVAAVLLIAFPVQVSPLSLAVVYLLLNDKK